MERGALDDGPHPAVHRADLRDRGPPDGPQEPAPMTVGTASRPGGGLARSRAGRARRADRAATLVLWAIAILVITILLAIIAHFVIASIGVISISFLTSAPSDTDLGGIGPLIWNSLYILVLTLIFTVPPGILGGIYMAEYAREGRVTEAIRFCQEL